MNDFQKLIRQIEDDYSPKGHKFVATVGSNLFGKTRKGKDTWHHALFRPLSEKEIDTLESQVGIKFPDILRQFYRVSNGLNLFSDELSIDGLRGSYARSADNAWQPYSLVEPNTLERPSEATQDEIFIGGYSYDGSRIKLNIKTGKIAACKPDSAKDTFSKWPDLITFLRKEYARLKKCFDDNLELIDPDGSTLPE
jgi:hypothetical protein